VGLAIPSGQSIAMDIAHGPINVVSGVVFGSLAGVLLGCTALWRTRLLRTLATLCLSQLLMSSAVHFHFTGAGALGSLMMSLVATKFWSSEHIAAHMPAWFYSDRSDEFAHETESDVALFWQVVAQPLLFGIIGTTADFDVLESRSLPRAMLVVATGVFVRLPTAALVTFGAGLNIRERYDIGTC
jgi:solute carrier family 9B (sodium/hydrogen exchanger), member 1/2